MTCNKMTWVGMITQVIEEFSYLRTNFVEMRAKILPGNKPDLGHGIVHHMSVVNL